MPGPPMPNKKLKTRTSTLLCQMSTSGDRLSFLRPGSLLATSLEPAKISTETAKMYASQGFKLLGRKPLLQRARPALPRERYFTRQQADSMGSGIKASTKIQVSSSSSSGGGVDGNNDKEVVVYRATPPGDFFVARWVG